MWWQQLKFACTHLSLEVEFSPLDCVPEFVTKRSQMIVSPKMDTGLHKAATLRIGISFSFDDKTNFVQSMVNLEDLLSAKCTAPARSAAQFMVSLLEYKNVGTRTMPRFEALWSSPLKELRYE